MHALRKALRKVTAVALGAGVLAGSLVAWSAPASAGVACGGTRIESQPLKNVSGTTIGWLNVYWDGTNNCAEMQSSGATWGKRKWMVAAISSCRLSDKGSTYCHTIDDDSNSGNFEYYAGPARVNGVGRCIAAWGEISDLPGDNHVYQVFTKPYVGHC
ncbi:hypothetical protein MTP10_27230 [Nonomuraea sp. 3-1Str]|uniref:hypothetical protein n=1 Tax=Nonomuraea sp. 3-1Str TaxID=2929801 RepID=UPI00285B4129|nr:hypothetical protein [Nonomuraea sp. 3-1Str]MDR8412411.1 hypothetical protein [Nonomuraea sp. 3-1Str]